MNMPICELCGSSAIKKMYKKDGFWINKCCHCNFHFVFPQEPAECSNQRYNSSEYFNTQFVQKFGYGDYISTQEINEAWFKTILDEILVINPSPQNILDVGCAVGFFLNVCKEHNIHAEGLERSDFARDYGIKQFGHTIHKGTIELNTIPNNSYDVITLFDVIEHVQDVNKAFMEIGRILKPNGLIVINTPDNGSFSQFIMRRFWFHYKPFEHSYFFDKQSLSGFLDKIHCTPIAIKRCHKILNLDVLINRIFHYNSHIPKVLQSIIGNSPVKYKSFPFPTGEFTLYARK